MANSKSSHESSQDADSRERSGVVNKWEAKISSLPTLMCIEKGTAQHTGFVVLRRSIRICVTRPRPCAFNKTSALKGQAVWTDIFYRLRFAYTGLPTTLSNPPSSKICLLRLELNRMGKHPTYGVCVCIDRVNEPYVRSLKTQRYYLIV